MGKASRTKGAGFERSIAAALRLVFPDAYRGLQSRDARECDVEGTPFRIECKAYKAYPNILKALQQADEDGREHGDTRIPIAITKKDRTVPIVSMTVPDFIKMIEEMFYSKTDDA